ncbi:hypothetical protein MLD38_022633 [Melastoma candidum]|uniref:Uncharacterized protein n=1 Tax=Melastoma candidum TaxID=119954 RepID=A0ACB9QJR4_9MYRT|nr:hypothetical protein MLD38_022633 [Melastoma candidum]
MEMPATAMASVVSPYFLCIVLLLVSLYLAFRPKSSAGAPCCPLPPGSMGWPVLGESLDLHKAGRQGYPERFLSSRTSRYSPDIFRTSLLGENVAVFCGAPGNKFLLSGDNGYVKMWIPSSLTKVLIDPEICGDLPKLDAKRMRGYLLDFLKREALKHYVPVMDSVAKEHLMRDWFPNVQMRVFPSVKDYTFTLACRNFMNIENDQDVKKLSAPFANITPGLFSVPINIHGTPFNKAVKGGSKMREEMVNVIRKKRDKIERGEDGNTRDLLTRLLQETDDNDVEIAQKIIGLLVASHETTSTAITMTVNYLAQFPHIYDQVYKEQQEIAKNKHDGETLTWEDTQKMKYSWNVACESMRLSPPALGTFREAVTDFTYAGYTIPKGWKTFWTVYSTHKNPEYFPDPEKFDPTRFEGGGPVPFSFVPFGGGPRMCPGKEYARIQILTFIHNLVVRFRFEKVD